MTTSDHPNRSPVTGFLDTVYESVSAKNEQEKRIDLLEKRVSFFPLSPIKTFPIERHKNRLE